MGYLEKELFKLQDIEYKNFHKKLVPTVDEENIIGIRIPILRKFAMEFAKTEYKSSFLKDTPHKYYEENILHALLINMEKNYDKCIQYLDEFLPYVDNWATSDIISPKVFKKNLPNLIVKIKEWTSKNKTYTVRVGIKMLMTFYLDDAFRKEYLDIVANIKSDEYYVNMMIAWFFATALAKRYDETIIYLEEKKLDKWTHNKTIQKCQESYRISKTTKEYLKKLKL